MPQQYPEPTVGALIFNVEGKIFLMASPKWKGKFAVPGGHVEIGETLEQAVRREVKEETNLDVEEVQFVKFQEFILGKEFHKPMHFLFFDFRCTTKGGNVVLNDEGTNFLWITVEEALHLPLASSTRSLITQCRKNRQDPVR